MKFRFTAIILIAMFFAFASQVSAQFNVYGNLPRTYYSSELPTKINTLTIPAPDVSILKAEDLDPEKTGQMYRIGVSVNAKYDFFQVAELTQLKDGAKVYRLKIKSEAAKGIAVYYSKFQLALGSVLNVFKDDKTFLAGTYTSAENPIVDEFATPYVVGDHCVIEYYEPAGVSGSVIFIDHISYAYRGMEPISLNKDFGSSDNCEVNVNCTEGANFQNQKRAVVRILVTDNGQQGWCSGAMMNNTAGDCKNYMLTANHCGGAATASNLNQWIFYFNYEAPACSNPSSEGTLANQTKTGATRRAGAGTISDVVKSDYLLLELNSAIPATYNVFYAGWNRSTSATTGGVGIHHPAGDIKKISKFSGTTTSAQWNGQAPANSHWQVTWVATTNGHGVTEGGSSGSPLFDNNGRVIGDLSGGSSFCNTPSQPDLYGKFSYSWDQGGTTAATRLKDWLDAGNTGATTLDGKNSCTTQPPLGQCDTTGNFIPGQHTASQLAPAAPATGFIAGNNSYLDKAKCDKFTDTYPVGSTVNGAFLAFFNATGSGNATIALWDNTGAGGTPGNIQRQATIALSNIPTNGNAIYFDLTSNPYTITSDFYIGVVLPTGSGSSAALYTTDDGEVNPGTAWEQFSDNTWHAMSETSSWGINIACAVFPIICPKVNGTSTEEISLKQDELLIYPNPSNGIIHVVLPKSNRPEKIRITDITGKTLKEFAISSLEGEQVQYDLGDLANGIYLLEARKGTDKTVKRILISK